MSIHSLGKLFVATMRLERNTPVFSSGLVYEVEHPFRTGNSVLLRLFGTLAIQVGWWGIEPDPDDSDEIQHHLLKAMRCASGTESFQEIARDNWEVQNSRVQTGEYELHEVAPEDFIK